MRALSGVPIKPEMLAIEVSTSNDRRESFNFLSKTCITLCRSVAVGRLIISTPLCSTRKQISGCTRAIRSTSLIELLSSVWSDLRNFLLAGTLKKMFFIMKLLPVGHMSASCRRTFEPSMKRAVPSSSCSILVCSSTCATAAIEGSASPRKPKVESAKRSFAWVIFDVACLSKAIRASVSDIPQPSSIT